MKYIYFKNPVILKGYYEEPIYDEHPSMGNYTRDISRRMYNEVVNYDEECNHIILYDEYGVSLHGSTAHFHINLDKYVKSGDVILVDETFHAAFNYIQAALRKNREEEYWINERIYCSESISEEDSKRISDDLLRTALEEVHLKAQMAQLQLSML